MRYRKLSVNESLDSASAAARDYQTCPGERIYREDSGRRARIQCVLVYVCVCV